MRGSDGIFQGPGTYGHAFRLAPWIIMALGDDRPTSKSIMRAPTSRIRSISAQGPSLGYAALTHRSRGG